MISSEDRIPRTTVRVTGRKVSVAAAGKGPKVILLHGNTTYSYAWRNVIPYLAQRHLCLAPDLLGMGRSDVLTPSGPSSYSFSEQSTYTDLLIELLAEEDEVVLIGHEMGAMLAIHHARRNPERVKGLVIVEGVFRITNDEHFPRDVREFLMDVRGDRGNDLVLRQNEMIEYWLPRLTLRPLSEIEMNAYRYPYRIPGEARRPLLSMIRQLPLRSTPGPLDELAEQSRLWSAQSRIPKLVVGGDPGLLVPPSILGTAARWANTTVSMARGQHYIMEDSPARLTSILIDWLAEVHAVRHRS